MWRTAAGRGEAKEIKELLLVNGREEVFANLPLG